MADTSSIAEALGDLCSSMKQVYLTGTAISAAVLLLFGIAAYFSYKKYGSSKSKPWLAATLISALIAVLGALNALYGVLQYLSFQGVC